MEKHKTSPTGKDTGGGAPAHSEILQVTGRLGERKCADRTGTVPVPGLAISNAKI